MIGKKIAHYQITSKLGEGSMGEVYRATDTRLNREVALKVLPESFINDPNRMARFEREAQVLASLSHPNVAGIYGLEEADGIRCLVLELIEGDTLYDRLKELALNSLLIGDTVCLVKHIATGFSDCIANDHACLTSSPSAGLITSKFGIKRKDEICSTG